MIPPTSKKQEFGLYFYLISILLLSLFLFVKNANATKVILLNDKKIANVLVAPGKVTILNFPVKPKKVVLGTKGLFSVEYVESDLAISALRANVKSNLFVYLEGRRFAFNLETTLSRADEIILVRDQLDKPIKVKIHE